MLFTFQYGQIYYTSIYRKNTSLPQIYIPIWLDLLYVVKYKQIAKLRDLHSNMVRFIMREYNDYKIDTAGFTFQYGQIYYTNHIEYYREYYKIYIPIWLDLLYKCQASQWGSLSHLHSNMVRFIISRLASGRNEQTEFTFQYGQIYYSEEDGYNEQKRDLHSNMVRFIIRII